MGTSTHSPEVAAVLYDRAIQNPLGPIVTEHQEMSSREYMFYLISVGFCPACETPLSLAKVPGPEGTEIVNCLECGIVLTSKSVVDAALTPEQLDFWSAHSDDPEAGWGD